MNECDTNTVRDAKTHSEVVSREFCIWGSFGSLLVLGALILFVLTKDTNYCGMSPWVLSLVFVPTLVVGVRAMLRSGPHLPSNVAVLSGAIGMSYLYYLDHTGRMISYMEMIWRAKNGQ